MQLEAWGYNAAGQCNIPAGLSGVVQVAGGWYHTAALKRDGTVVAWGGNFYGQCNVPAGLSGVVQVEAGSEHTVALKSDGTVVAWGVNWQGQCNVPAGLSEVVQVEAGLHTVALKSDGTVVSWGNGSYVPAGLSGVVQVAAGALHTVALRSDGTVVAWGGNTSGECTVPVGLSGVVKVAAGGLHSVALKSDGTVVAWGGNFYGQCNVPAGLSGVVQVVAGSYNTVALKSDGTVVFWGDGSFVSWRDGSYVPAGLSGVVQVAAGDNHIVALRMLLSPSIGTFTIPAQTYGNSPFDLTSPKSTSDGAWSYSSGNTNVATVNGNTVTITGAGTAVITATQSASGNFIGISATANLEVNKGSQAITGFSPLGTKAFGSAVPLNVINSSGQPIVWTSSNTNVAVVNGTNLTILGVGTTTITASHPGDANWAAATPVSQTLVVNKGSQAITGLSPLGTKAFGSAVPLNVINSSGQPIVWTSSNTNVAVVNAMNLTIVGVGTTTITASQEGDANWQAATPVSQTLVVNKGLQTIKGFVAFTPSTFGSVSTIPLNGSNSSGRPLTWTSSNTNVATVNGTNVSIVGAGTSTITASQAGDANWQAATPVIQTLVVNKGSQAITGFSSLGTNTYGSVTTIPLSVSNSSGRPLTWTSSNTNVAVVTGTNVRIVGAGTTTITSSQAGNANWQAATPVSQTLVVNKASQSLSFPSISNQVASSPFAPSVSSSSGLSVNFSVVSGPAVITNGQCVFTNIGTVVLAANQMGNSNYLSAPQVTQTFSVTPGTVPFFATVGDPRNPCEDGAGFDEENAGIGYVGQPYQISVSEITNLMYARFLNAVAAGDNFYGLYATRMATDSQGGIIRGGRFPNYTYTVKAGFENRPVNFVSLYSALRYINWLHNGMPATGVLDDTSTEDGAYTLHGNNIPDITRNAGAKYFLPDQDEWHKAAFFDPSPADANLPSDYYWPYADQSQNGPGGNYSGTLADVGTGSGISHYGTYDQGGNVAEWTESVIYNPQTGIYDLRITSGGRSYTSTPNVSENFGLGFRVGKTIPQQTTNPLVVPRMVPVELPNNLGDQSSKNRGSLAYNFQVGTYEVSNTEYAAFLNAVAKNDAFYRLYSTYMGTDPNGGIMRSGSNGSFLYTVKSGSGNKPVNFVSIYSAMRFCNWLHNGAQPLGDTEEGAYRLLGNATANIAAVQRNTSARYFLPSVDEWHKGAFYDPSPAALPSASYWTYATKSRVPSSTQINYSGATYGSLTTVNTPGVSSYFGTYGQSGNAAEWTEDIYQDPVTRVIYRVVAGGNWASTSSGVSSQGYVNTLPTGTFATGGFRIASITGMPLGPKTNPALGNFLIPARAFGSAPFALTPPTSTSSGAWSYSSGNTNVATISGNTVTIRGVGTAVITATQAASGNFTGASATGNLVVTKGFQTINFTQPAAQTFVPNGTFALSATAPGGAVAFTSSNTNVISIVGATATMRGVGTAVITANQAGNANYAAATAVTRSVTVNKGSQTITFNPPATNTYVANGIITFPTTASSGLTIAYTSSNTNVLTVSGAIATMKAKGTVNVTASQAGNTNFNAAISVAKPITLK